MEFQNENVQFDNYGEGMGSICTIYEFYKPESSKNTLVELQSLDAEQPKSRLRDAGYCDNCYHWILG